ncbi:hypothetical protein HCN44_007105 [Aphidius gifuensis]|uniref:Uncharacterized protein n=1 Tax=Aphidius gifuensis TaxID=684658 RepID=A0A834XP39_APHGI|nr:hypothetical protein HCN44_007105 [Aphidius gifuensis]
MKEQGQNRTTPIEIKEVEQQQQPETIKIKSELIIDNNEPEKVAEQIPSCSTNFDYPGYPGFIEAVRQAKEKKKSHDASFEIFFPYLPESVKKQHDFNLNGWWKYCLSENKDPLETDLSVVNSYLEKKLNAGASPDDLESISCTIRLIATDTMEKQMNSLRFMFINKTDCFKPPKSSCQNDSITSSLHIGTKKQDGSKISSVQIDNVQKAKLSEVIDISDDELDTESPTKLLKKSKDLLNNNELTNFKKNIVFLKKAVDNSQLILPLIKPTSTKPPAILLCPASKKKVCKNNEIKELIPGCFNGQQTQVVKVLENNKENQQITIKSKSLKEPTQSKMSDIVVDNETGSSNKKDPTIPIPKEKQNEDEEQPQLTLPANTNQAIDPSTKTLTPAIEPAAPVKSPVHHSPLPLIPCQLNTSVLECSSEKLKQNKAETTDNLQSKLSSGNTVQNEQLQQQQLPSAINIFSNDVAPSTYCLKSLTPTSVTLKLQTSSAKTLIPAIQSPRLSANLSAHHDTQPLLPCQLNTSALECSSKVLAQNKLKTGDNLQSGLLLRNAVQKKQQKPLANNNQAIDPPTKTMTLAIKPSTPAKLPVHHNTSPSTPCEINSSESDYSSKRVKRNIVEKSADLQTELQLSNAAPKIQQQQVESEADAIVDLTQTSDNDDDDNDAKNTRKSLKLQSVLKCRTVKIGSYKYTPKNNVIINTTGLILSVPLLEDETETVKVHVQYQDIYKVLIHSDSSKPILFFYTNTISGSKIRKLLGMNNPKGPYYDPACKNQTHKRIILFPKLLKSSSSMILTKLFSSNTFVKELNAKEANAILSKGASLKKPKNSSSKVDKRQTTIVNTNKIVENSTNHRAAPTEGEDKSITKAKSAKLSFINKDTNASDKNKEKSNSGNDELTNNDSRQKTSSVIIKKTSSDKNFSNTICSTSKSKNLLSLGKNHTTSDNNSQGSIQTEINNNNKRKHSQLEVSRQKTSPVIIKKTKLDKNQPARKNDDDVLYSVLIRHKPRSFHRRSPLNISR